MLLAWVPISVLLLVWTTSYSGDLVEPVPPCRCGEGEVAIDTDKCKCVKREREAVVNKIPTKESKPANPSKPVHHEEQDTHHEEVADRKPTSEAARVLEDYPSLQYAEEGETACQKANEVWRERVKAAYGNSQDEIKGREGIHLFFTTDCTRHSLWQALTLEHSWARVRQPGALTRIVSGCFSSKGEEHSNTPLMKRRIISHQKFFIFFGPRVGGRAPPQNKVICQASTNGWYEGPIIAEAKAENGLDDCKQQCRETPSCRYYNFRHADKVCHMFSERSTFHDVDDHSTGVCTAEKGVDMSKYRLPDYLADYPPINRPATAMYWLNYAKPLERVLGLLDPDMIFARPMLFHHIGDQVVEKGKPVGQFYDYLVSQDWDKHYTAICNEPDVCKPLGNKKDFAPGPPHLMHRRDWQDLAPWWLRYTIGARKLWRAWTSEMAGMSIGLARLGLRSRLVEDGMWDRTTAAADMLRHLDAYYGGDVRDSWKQCAMENQECDVPDDADYRVRYGPDPDRDFVEKPARGIKLHCSHNVNDLGKGYFEGDDPAPGHAKFCFYSNPAKAKKIPTNVRHKLDEEGKWVYCAEEGGHCILPVTTTYSVRFGTSSVSEYIEKKGVKGGSTVQCIEQAGEKLAFDSDPSSGKPKQCFYKPETGSFPPPELGQYIPKEKLPSLFHYCFTLEVNRGGWPEKLWRNAVPQKEWETKHKEPLLGYIHWSKYRSLTDWPRNDRAHTMLECDQPLLFHFPPLPEMLQNYSKNNEDKGWHVFFAIVSPAINAALIQYKLQYCEDPHKINYERRVRTAHDQYWVSHFETVMDPEDAKGYTFVSHLTN